MPEYYLRMEGVNLGNFVYDTHDLSTIRGGGLLLLESPCKIRDKIKSKYNITLEEISTGASSGLFRFDVEKDEDAKEVRLLVENLLKEAENGLQYATFVVDLKKISVLENHKNNEKSERKKKKDNKKNKNNKGAKTFVKDKESLIALNRWNQMQSPSVALPDKGNYSNVCSIDLVSPAAERPSYGKYKDKYISTSADLRRKHGKNNKKKFYKKHTDLDLPYDFTNDLEELSSDKSKGNIHHKIAVIYLDGNNFGKIQNNVCKTAEIQKDFDDKLKAYRKEMLVELMNDMNTGEKVKDWLMETEEKQKYRIETLLWGGDELIWIVPAWLGWYTLSFFYEKSKNWNYTEEKQNRQKLTHGGGIVFCHHNAPIHRITKLAEDLAKLAKKKNREENLFAWQVLEAFDHIGQNLEDFRKKIYSGGVIRSDELIFSGGDMKKIAAEMDKLKKAELPRNKVCAIAHSLFDKKGGYNKENNELKGKSSKLAEKALESIKNNTEKEKPMETMEKIFPNKAVLWLFIAELWDYL